MERARLPDRRWRVDRAGAGDVLGAVAGGAVSAAAARGAAPQEVQQPQDNARHPLDRPPPDPQHPPPPLPHRLHVQHLRRADVRGAARGRADQPDADEGVRERKERARGVVHELSAGDEDAVPGALRRRLAHHDVRRHGRAPLLHPRRPPGPPPLRRGLRALGRLRARVVRVGGLLDPVPDRGGVDHDEPLHRHGARLLRQGGGPGGVIRQRHPPRADHRRLEQAPPRQRPGHGPRPRGQGFPPQRPPPHRLHERRRLLRTLGARPPRAAADRG
mmetsp:Transcript_7828/g.18453  ORF Transcript_7828/g.18453 Transcript_7828/m.18453 type:complete len:274 (-) Transcript_7828:431-1252(-)